MYKLGHSRTQPCPYPLSCHPCQPLSWQAAYVHKGRGPLGLYIWLLFKPTTRFSHGKAGSERCQHLSL